METAEARNQIIAAIKQNTGDYPTSIIDNILESYAKEHAIDGAESLSDYLYNWLKDQKYGEENILHAAVCCDYVGMVRFKKAITNLINEWTNKKE